MPEARWTARFGEAPEGPLRQLVQPVLLAPDLQAPRLLLGGRRIAQLRKRDPHLGGPAERIDRRLYLPHRVPGIVRAAAQAVGVPPPAGGIHPEEQPAAVGGIGAENHFYVVR